MKARIKFQKYGVLKFIGHLDLMRYFQKTLRRANIDITYSQGYSPHMIMSFASPLGVGITSDGEYLDIELNRYYDAKEFIDIVNKEMVEGVKILEFTPIKDKTKNSMSLISAADYIVSLKDDYSDFFNMNKEEFESKFNQFMEQETIIITKKTKKSTTEVNIKPYIYDISFDTTSHLNDNTVAQTYDNGIKLYMNLATGSVQNLKPELVIEAFCNYLNIEYNKFCIQTHRIDMYSFKNECENKYKDQDVTSDFIDINDLISMRFKNEDISCSTT